MNHVANCKTFLFRQVSGRSIVIRNSPVREDDCVRTIRVSGNIDDQVRVISETVFMEKSFDEEDYQ